MEEFLMRIGDCWQAASSKEWIESENPYTGKPWARVPRGTAQDAEAAVAAAHEAFSNGPWSRMAPADRSLLLYKLADCMAADAEHLADLEVRDTGKLKAEMLGNLRYLPRWYQCCGGLADKVEGSVTPIDKPGMLHCVVHESGGSGEAFMRQRGWPGSRRPLTLPCADRAKMACRPAVSAD